MNMFKEVADIKTSDQLHLPVPEAKFETVVVQPSEYQKDMVASLSERAADVHAGIVDPSVDNMLKITSDGQKIGTGSAANEHLCYPMTLTASSMPAWDNMLHIWQDGQADKLTQLGVLRPVATPKNDGTFNVYDDVKTKLLANWCACGRSCLSSMMRIPRRRKKTSLPRFVPGRCECFLAVRKRWVQEPTSRTNWWQFTTWMWAGVRLI